MHPHFHSGIVAVLVYGLSAVLVFNLMRLAAAKMVENPATEKAGRVIGGLVA